MRVLVRSGKIQDRRDTCTVGRERSMGSFKKEKKEKRKKKRKRKVEDRMW